VGTGTKGTDSNVSETLFSADLHLGHANICPYAGRPFYKPEWRVDGKWISMDIKDMVADNMTKALIRNINQRVTIDDTLYHIGDFCCRGNERGVPGGRMKARELEREIECRIVHILGNHDRNNGVESGLDSANMTFGGNIQFHLRHRPLTSPYQAPDGTDCVLCGHVHEKWHTQWLGNILQINVGVDVNKFIPLTKNEIVGIYQKETRERAKLREVSE